MVRKSVGVGHAGTDAMQEYDTNPHERPCVLRATVAGWAAAMGYLCPDGQCVGQFTLDVAVAMAVTGELYELAPSQFQGCPVHAGLPPTPPAILSSAGNRVFIIDEIVNHIVSAYSDALIAALEPRPIPGIPPRWWASNMRRLCRVNAACFDSVSVLLRSYVPRFAFLTAVIANRGVHDWCGTPSVPQW